MRYIYFTKLLKGRDAAGMAEFIRSAGLNGADFAVRPGYPVEPKTIAKTLPEAVKVFKDYGLSIPLVTGPTNLTDPADAETKRIFEACGKNGVEAIKIGYFPYTGNYNEALAAAQRAIAGFSELSQATGVRACYHTHSGDYIGSNCAGMRLLFEKADPHHIGAFVDTGHQTIGGAPFRMALDMVAPWLSLIAIKDIAWEKTDKGWKSQVVPAGEGIANWQEIRQALKERKYNGIISLHGEYHDGDTPERLEKARAELAFLRNLFGQ